MGDLPSGQSQDSKPSHPDFLSFDLTSQTPRDQGIIMSVTLSTLQFCGKLAEFCHIKQTNKKDRFWR